MLAQDKIGYIYTRKKCLRSGPPTSMDFIAWRHCLVGGKITDVVVLVFRDPFDLESWISREEHDQRKMEIRKKNIPVSTRGGNVPVLKPLAGAMAWLIAPGSLYRKPHLWDGFSWRRIRRAEVVTT